MESEQPPHVSVPQPAPTPQPASRPQPAPSKPKRPSGITFLGMVFILSGIMRYVYGFSQTSIVELIGFSIGIIWFIIGYSFFKPKNWTWKVAIIFIIFDMAEIIVRSIIVSPIISIYYMETFFEVLINLIILYYLFRPNVKRYFGKNASPAPPNVPPTTTSDSPNKI